MFNVKTSATFEDKLYSQKELCISFFKYNFYNFMLIIEVLPQVNKYIIYKSILKLKTSLEKFKL